MGNISTYKKDVSIIKIVEADLSLLEVSPAPKERKFPYFCTWANGKKVGIATEYIEDEKAYLVDISTNKIFSSVSFKNDELPSSIGMPIYVTAKGELTGKKEGNTEAGLFMGLEKGAVLFKLQ